MLHHVGGSRFRPGAASISEFFSDWQTTFVPSSIESAALAGRSFRTDLERSGIRGRVVPDFLERLKEDRGRYIIQGARASAHFDVDFPGNNQAA